MRNRAQKPDRRSTDGQTAGSPRYPWYDSAWLAKYVRARTIVQSVQPENLNAFVDAFRVLRTSADFQARLLDHPFDDRTFQEIRRVALSLRPIDLELHEARAFGRFVVHDHPFFDALQACTEPLVSEAVGEPVQGSYNFLSLYGSRGICLPHMDSPEAKWTLRPAVLPLYPEGHRGPCSASDVGAAVWRA
jgi:hypothetical protein